jgi:hypothetical protein
MNDSPRVRSQVQLKSMINKVQNIVNGRGGNVERHAAPGPVAQRMVLLPAGTADIDTSDLVVFNMIDYALDKVGGPIVSAWDAPNLKTLKETEELFVVEHGKPGRFDNPKKNVIQPPKEDPEKNVIPPSMVDKVIEALTNKERGLPDGFTGTIHVTACWAGVGDDPTPSVVTRITGALTNAGFTGVTVLGAKGPTTGYQVGSVPRAVNPEYWTDAALPPREVGNINKLRGEMEDWLAHNKGVSIAEAARKARELTREYLPKYVRWLSKKGYLLEESQGFERVQS